MPKPSTRAAAVLGLVGLFLGPDAVMPPALAIVSPDAELLALAAEYIVLDREVCRRCDAVANVVRGNPEYDAYYRCARPVVDQMRAMEDRLAGMRAHTAEGLRAQAMGALHVMSGNADRVPEPMEDSAAVAWAVCMVVAGRV